MPKISIIVPIYNVEQYLSICLDSVLAQTFTDFELILVNDGSEDNCGEICDRYALKDKRIKVIHKTNDGVSSARNAGIKISKGNYIGFVDPDDTIEPNMYKELFQAAEKFQADMVVCPYTTIDFVNNTKKVSSIWKICNAPLTQKEVKDYIIPSVIVDKYYSLVSSVNKLYRKEVFDLYNIRFDEQKHHGEDARLNFILLTLVEKLVFVKEPLYNYFIRKRDSLSQVFRVDLYKDALDNKKFLINWCEQYNLLESIDTVKNHYTSIILGNIQEIIANEDIRIEKKSKIIATIINNKEFEDDIKIYKCPSLYYKLLKKACIIKNEKVILILEIIKIRLKSLKVGKNEINKFN